MFSKSQSLPVPPKSMERVRGLKDLMVMLMLPVGMLVAFTLTVILQRSDSKRDLKEFGRISMIIREYQRLLYTILDFIGLYLIIWITLDYIGLYWIIMDYIGLYWIILDYD